MFALHLVGVRAQLPAHGRAGIGTEGNAEPRTLCIPIYRWHGEKREEDAVLRARAPGVNV